MLRGKNYQLAKSICDNINDTHPDFLLANTIYSFILPIWKEHWKGQSWEEIMDIKHIVKKS